MAQSSQSTVKPGVQSQQTVQLISGSAHRQAVAQLSKLTWTDGKWVSDSESTSSSAKSPKPEGDFEGQVFDDVTGLYTEANVRDEAEEGGIGGVGLASAEAKKEEGKKEEPKADPVPGLINVSLAAGKHIWGIAMIGNSNNPNPNSFSFAKQSTITADNELINRYLVDGKTAGVGVEVFEENKYRITVMRGGQTRTYEVHKAHSLQAFPVSGVGVVNNANAGCDLKAVKEVVKSTRGRLDQLTAKKPWHHNANRINAIISAGN